MLYFIKSQKFLKIGYTKDRITYQERMNTYCTHNPDFVVIDVTEDGTLNDEKRLHKLLKDYNYRLEWFYDRPEIHDIWNLYTKDMKRYDPYEYKEREKKKAVIYPERTNSIREYIQSVLGDEIEITGEEITDIMREACFKYGINKNIYLNIKNIKNFGYTFTRFKKNNKFFYKLTKVD